MTTIENVTRHYRRIANLVEYLKKSLKENPKVLSAEKKTRIMAKKGVPGEVVTTWTVDSNGDPLIELEASVKVDEQTGHPDWVVTKVDNDGNIIIDKNGHSNTWIIADKVFKKKYIADSLNIFRPVGGIQRFIRITEPVIIEDNGREFYLDAGGYINVTNPEDCYAISERDFNDTYSIIE